MKLRTTAFASAAAALCTSALLLGTATADDRQTAQNDNPAVSLDQDALLKLKLEQMNDPKFNFDRRGDNFARSGPPVNDECAGAIAITDGTTAFSPAGATDSGPDEPTCAFPFGGAGNQDINQDLWYTYVATCDGTLFVDTCGADPVDTRLAIYDGGACPPAGAPLECNDDHGNATEADTGMACPAALEASLSIPVVMGNTYTIRVGVFSTSGTVTGMDQLNVACLPAAVCGNGVLEFGEECDDGNLVDGDGCDSMCNIEAGDVCGVPGSGDCFTANGTPGCDDAACCDTVCGMDAFCCDTEWDQVCADQAFEFCAGAPDVRCCFIDPNTGVVLDCQDLQFADCEAMGGTPSPGLNCTDDPCEPLPTGRCCYDDTCVADFAMDDAGPACGSDGVTDTFDLLQLLSEWNTAGVCADIGMDDGGPAPGSDGIVDTFDLLLLLSNWNCMASGTVCEVNTSARCAELGGTWDAGLNCVDDPCPTPPVNDECADCTVITMLPFAETSDTTLAAPGLPIGSCNSSSATDMDNDIWYCYTPTEDCTIIYTADHDYDGITAVYSGPDCDNLTELFCFDPDPIGESFAATAGTTYWFQLGDWGSFPGGGTVDFSLDCITTPLGACCSPIDGSCTDPVTQAECEKGGGIYQGDNTDCDSVMCPEPIGACCFCDTGCMDSVAQSACEDGGGIFQGGLTLCADVDCPVVPANDACADAILTDVGLIESGNTCCATTDDVGTCGTSAPNQGVWYSVIGTGTELTVSTCNPGTDFDTKLQVFCGGCEVLACVGGNDDAVGAPAECDLNGLNRKSIVTFCSAPGVEYLIHVGGFGSACGNYELTVTDTNLKCGDPPICAEPTGRCCLPGFAANGGGGDICQDDQTEADCLSSGGIWEEGADCTSGCPVGRCCSDLVGGGVFCDDWGEATCALSAGDWDGGLSCATDPCPVPLVNDECLGAIEVFDGATPIDLTGATGSGQAACGDFPFGNDEINQDLWYTYVATCTGELFVDTCGGEGGATTVDTRLAVYVNSLCSAINTGVLPDECNDDHGNAAEGDTGNTCGGDFEAALSIPVSVGDVVFIRVGTFSPFSATQPDVLNIDCVPAP